jgi:hypothetical protein
MPSSQARETRAQRLHAPFPRNIHAPTRKQRARRAHDTDNKLTEEQKTQVVQRLAGYESTAAIAKWLREECGVSISRQGVEYYDPTSSAGGHCAERWRTLFLATRDAITAGRAEVGATHRMVRVRWLDAMAHAEMDKGSFARAAKLLAQIAREMDAWDKRHQPDKLRARDMTDAERARRLTAAAALLGLALVPVRATEQGSPTPAASSS